MSKADKMFKELGYQKSEEDIMIRYICFGKSVLFNKKWETYKISDPFNFTPSVTQNLHLAIHEKLKELGWIE